jgi:hypothetical protein
MSAITVIAGGLLQLLMRLSSESTDLGQLIIAQVEREAERFRD